MKTNERERKKLKTKRKEITRTMRVWLPLRGSSSFASLHFNYHYHHNWNLALCEPRLSLSLDTRIYICERTCNAGVCVTLCIAICCGVANHRGMVHSPSFLANRTIITLHASVWVLKTWPATSVHILILFQYLSLLVARFFALFL